MDDSGFRKTDGGESGLGLSGVAGEGAVDVFEGFGGEVLLSGVEVAADEGVAGFTEAEVGGLVEGKNPATLVDVDN